MILQTLRTPTRNARRRPPLTIEELEDRSVPTAALAPVPAPPPVFNIGNGDTAGLIAAIQQADSSGQATTINLAAGGSYTLTAGTDNGNGPTGLPAVTGTVTINGNGATVQRQSGATAFRLLEIDGGTLTLDNVTVSGGSEVNGGFGGGVLVAGGTLNLSASTLSNNSITVEDGVASGGALGVENGATANLTDCLFTGNTGQDGGAIAVQQATANLTDCTLDGNTATEEGGGLANLAGTVHITDSTIRNNTAFNTMSGFPTASEFIDYGGGGLFNFAGGIYPGAGVLTLDASTVSGNSASRGGGLQNVSAAGGQATVTITDSSISGNMAMLPGDGQVGGLDNLSTESAPATLTLIDSTVANNSATADVGGISGNGTGSQINLSSSTVTGNTAGGTVGGLLNGGIFGQGTITLHDTLVAANTVGSNPSDVLGTFTSQGYNLIGAAGTATGFGGTDLVNVTPLLGPLQDNGGPTQTVALLPGSAGIDQGDPNYTGPATDQRGLTRVANGRIDIGAFEVQPVIIVINPTPAPLPPPLPVFAPPVVVDVTGLVIVEVISRTKHGLMQTLLVFNPTGFVIQGPLYLVLDGLTKGVKLKNASGTTQAHLKKGEPYLMLPLFELDPGQSLTVDLSFSSPNNAAINFNPVVLVGPGVV